MFPEFDPSETDEDAIKREARILVVDDEEPNVFLLEQILERAGFHGVRSTTDSREVIGLFEDYQPDILLLDLLMPHLDGYEVLEKVRATLPDDDHVPVLVLTADVTRDAMQRSLAGGADDFLTKPFDPTEVTLRMRNLLATRFLQRALRRHRDFLHEEVTARTEELAASHFEIMERLSSVTEFRDFETGEHTKRVGKTARAVAETLGLADQRIDLIGLAAPLHDVGKIATPDAILLKPGRLTPEEFDVVKEHTTAGAQILGDGRFPLLQTAEEIALMHHEKWDGTGYAHVPGEEIPQSARITAVADVFDALTHIRPYKEPWPLEKAVEEIRTQRGAHFDPDCVDAFLAALEAGEVEV